jgi:arsenite-transporting ATPase
MPTVLLTGPGGAGTSTLARAAAAAATASGEPVLLVRPAEPGDGASPALGPDGYHIAGVGALAWADEQWQALGPLRALLGPPWQSTAGSALLPVPGLAELAWWGVLREAMRTRWGLVVVDAGPVSDAVRWLGLPDLVTASMRRWWPVEERAAAAAARGGSWHTRAASWVESEAAELAAQMRAAASVHLVCPARSDRLGVALRSLAPLALHELPASSLTLVGAGAAEHVDRLAPRLPGLRVQSWSTADAPPDLAAGPRRKRSPRVGRHGSDYRWRWDLPLASPNEVGAVVVDDDLVLSVRGVRRSVLLPGVLRSCNPLDSTYRDGTLVVRFAPDPDLWPVGSAQGSTDGGTDGEG